MKRIYIKDSQIEFERKALRVIVYTLISVIISYVVSTNIVNNQKVEVKPTKIDIQIEVRETDSEPTYKKEYPYELGVGFGEPEYTPPAVQEVKQVARVSSISLDSILRGWKGSVTNDKQKLEFVYHESKKRGLDADLVIAVMALESGWLKSEWCTQHNNCFGFGITDSGPMAKYTNFKSFEEGTKVILDQYKKQGYGIGSARQMANNGYNTYASWVGKVEYIRSGFTK